MLRLVTLIMRATTFLAALGGILAVSAQEYPSTYRNPYQANVMLYTYTDGFRHDSIPTAIKQLQAWSSYYNITFDATEDQDKFTDENLAKYDAILFVHSTGNIFSTAGQTAFVNYLAKGGNFAAVHAASAAYLQKAWGPWTESLGATFSHHPARQNATFVKEMTGHPATDPAPDRWVIDEEVYSFTSDPRKLGAKLLFSVDPSSYKENNVVPEQGDPHPIAWCQDYSAGATITAGSPGPGIPGRSFYSSLGHLNATWMDPTFMKHILGGLTWTFASNTTRVAQGLYGTDPTVHTGSTNNSSSGAVGAWAPVLGSNQLSTNSAPPASASPTTASGPEGTAGTTSSSGALFGAAPVGLWTVAAAAFGAVLGSVL